MTADRQRPEDVQDDLADMLSVADEVQDALGQNYATPDVDESELEAELAALGDDLGLDSGYLDEALNAPSVPNTTVPGEGVPASAAGSKSTVVQADPEWKKGQANNNKPPTVYKFQDFRALMLDAKISVEIRGTSTEELTKNHWLIFKEEIVPTFLLFRIFDRIQFVDAWSGVTRIPPECDI
ncbi:hypothetical protein T265_01109 [Opisthorchis viverrini]|uniref:Uncharacterized protein n=1 Tax=Opisthorchis viverrini TaxID=6198 RepID=A0A075AJ58_OPIVI|nr:hypothetical protein T265_01109 [Opisthorchis viverrini]KER32809.1 hypothetical protein T265_01109 [Opisthorchis viverrini]